MPLRLFCVFAHPDDECFAFGGALALAADRGVEIYALCLTKGTSGSYRGGAKSDEELGRIRSEEFAAHQKKLKDEAAERRSVAPERPVRAPRGPAPVKGRSH